MANNWTIPDFPGFDGELQTISAAIRDKYKAVLDMFTPDPINGEYPHTNLEPGVRLSKDNPFLNPSNLNSAGMREIELAVIPPEIWEQKYASKAPAYAPKIPNVDKTKSVADQQRYYETAHFQSVPCSINACTTLASNGNDIKWWNPGVGVPAPLYEVNGTVFQALPHTMDIASWWKSNMLLFWVQDDSNTTAGYTLPFHLWEYQIDPTNCQVTLNRKIECPPPAIPGIAHMDDGAGGCAITQNIQLWGQASGGSGEGWVHEYDISGPVAVLTNAWSSLQHLIPGNSFTGSIPAGLTVLKSYIVGDMLYLPNQDYVVTTEQWHMSDGLAYPSRCVLRDRGNGYAYIDSCEGPNYNYALFCHDNKVYSTGSSQGLNNKSWEVFWDTSPMSLATTPTFNFAASGASTDPACCAGTGRPPVPNWVGYSCNQTSSGCPFPCLNSTANCGGNNADGSIQWEIDEIISSGGSGINVYYEWTVTDQNAVVVNHGIYDGASNTVTITVGQSQTTSANPIPNQFTYICWTTEGLLPGGYNCFISNFSGGGNVYPNMNISGIVLGDTPLACPGDPSCCPESYNCSGAPLWQCLDPLDGTGTYATLANCQANCNPPPPPPPEDPPEPGGSHCLIKNCDEH